MEERRYCIGCRHLAYSDKQMGQGSTMTGSWTYEQASMFCSKGHWKHYFDGYSEPGEAFERAMEHAETCKDFEERKP
jgi:hypothetical protein